MRHGVVGAVFHHTREYPARYVRQRDWFVQRRVRICIEPLLCRKTRTFSDQRRTRGGQTRQDLRAGGTKYGSCARQLRRQRRGDRRLQTCAQRSSCHSRVLRRTDKCSISRGDNKQSTVCTYPKYTTSKKALHVLRYTSSSSGFATCNLIPSQRSNYWRGGNSEKAWCRYSRNSPTSQHLQYRMGFPFHALAYS